MNWQDHIDEHRGWLRTVILARSGDAQAVDDVFQEVATAALKAPALRDPSKVAPFLYRIAVRQALKYRRRMGRQKRLHEQYVEMTPASAEVIPEDPLAWLLWDERRQQVRAAIEQLPTKDAEILLLKYQEQWSYKKIAERLGTTVNAIESRLHRARERLRNQLRTLDVVESHH